MLLPACYLCGQSSSNKVYIEWDNGQRCCWECLYYKGLGSGDDKSLAVFGRPGDFIRKNNMEFFTHSRE